MVTINTQGIQEWTVPATGNYSIEAHGASGGTHTTYAGRGANMYGEVYLTGGTTLYILVGQMGSQNSSGNSDGGGGGSFITDGSNLLFTAGGGGGGAQNVNAAQDASLTATVVNGSQSQFGSAGAGYSTNGIHFTYSTYTTVAQSFQNGGEGQAGGQASGWPGGTYGDGGFGGGGSACSCSTGGGGGGGGYVGGGGGGNGPYISGYGGSSYSIGSATNVSTSLLPGWGDGQVIITQLCSPLTVTASATTICDGDGVTLSATSPNGGTITWDNGVSNGVSFDPPVGTTTYTATSSDNNDCSYAVDITVNASPNATMTALPQDCFYDIAYALTNGSPAGGVYSGNGVINDDVFDPGAAGIGTHTITYTVTDPATGCTGIATTDVVVDECLGIEENTAVFEIYPNPTQDVINITTNGKFEFTLFNTLGQEITSGSGADSKVVDLSKVDNGPYLLQVTNGGSTKTIKILKK
jgi:hypothetical protein